MVDKIDGDGSWLARLTGCGLINYLGKGTCARVQLLDQEDSLSATFILMQRRRPLVPPTHDITGSAFPQESDSLNSTY